MKVATVVGARPQFIKLAPVVMAMGKVDQISNTLIHTGQHYDSSLSNVFFEELGIQPPDHHLRIGSGSHAQQTGKMLVEIEQILKKETPEVVLLFGDTNSTLAGALAASKLNIRVAHIEAGLRSYNRHMPEEINRILTDHSSDILFAPTKAAEENLLNEGFPQNKIMRLGDVMYDAALLFAEKAETQNTILENLNLEEEDYILTTIHRAENTNDKHRLEAILQSIRILGESRLVVFPVHPRTKRFLENNYGSLQNLANDQVKIIPPVGYLGMLNLIRNACLVLTDSGGIQKEAYFLKTLCITLRDETEWIELVDLGWNRIAPPRDRESIVRIVETMLQVAQEELSYPLLYGDGKAAQKIVNALMKGEAAFDV